MSRPNLTKIIQAHLSDSPSLVESSPDITKVAAESAAFNRALSKGFVDVEALYQKRGYLEVREIGRHVFQLELDKSKSFLFDPNHRLDSKGIKAIENDLTERVASGFIQIDADQEFDPEDVRNERKAWEAQVTLRAVKGSSGDGYKVLLNDEAKFLLKVLVR